MELIETTSPLHLRRLVRAINAAHAAYVDGSIVKRDHNPCRSAAASYSRADNTIRFFGGLHPQELFEIRAADAERVFCDGAGRTIVVTRIL